MDDFDTKPDQKRPKAAKSGQKRPKAAKLQLIIRFLKFIKNLFLRIVE